MLQGLKKLLLLTLLAVPVFFLLNRPEPADAGLPTAVGDRPLPSLAPILERVTPAVVNIYSRTHVRVRNPLLEDPFLRRFFNLPNMPSERIRQSLGSGVIIDAREGLVVTNHHVIDGADDIQVNLADGRTLQARLLGSDPETDVALLKIRADDLVALPLADSSRLRVGDFVVAVGNPFGLGQTVTSGIVSALGRTGLKGLGLQNFIQTDASINPGNSGGALINLRGELVGINSAIYSPSGGNVGIGFAIPVNLAQKVMNQLLEHGEVRRGTLGVAVQDLDSALAESLDLEGHRGAIVTAVDPHSPAEKAGLRAGDVIVQVDHQPVASAAAFRLAESLLPLGHERPLEVLRDGRKRRLQVEIDQPTPKALDGADLDRRLAGVLFISRAEMEGDRLAEGVVIDKMVRGSRLYRVGLRPGDRILRINREALRDLDQFQRLLQAKPDVLLLEVERNGRVYRLEV